MTTTIVILTVLALIAAILSAVMLIAWHSFGRPRHALVWACAFGVATAQWLCNLLLRTQFDSFDWLHGITEGLSCLSPALIAVGFFDRNRMPVRIKPWLLAAVPGPLALGVISWLQPGLSDRFAMGLAFNGMMMLLAASNVSSHWRSTSLPERAVIIMLLLSAVVDFALVGIALTQGITGHGQDPGLFRTVLMLLYPFAFVGVGIFSVFLVAADLAAYLRLQATSDELTGIYNRRGFEDAAEREIRNAQRQRRPLSVVVADIDSFKAINDRHDHIAGDRALKHFASRLERLLRRGDLIGRIGGEEFAVLLVNTRAQDAVEVVERIRRDIAAMPVEGAGMAHMTASFGVTGLRPGDISLAALLARADRALYRSKLDGRNRVTSAEDLDDLI